MKTATAVLSCLALMATLASGRERTFGDVRSVSKYVPNAGFGRALLQAGCPEAPPDYAFQAGQDTSADTTTDLFQCEQCSVAQLAELCTTLGPDCAAFNTSGWAKRLSTPMGRPQLAAWPGAGDCEGVYIKSAAPPEPSGGDVRLAGPATYTQMEGGSALEVKGRLEYYDDPVGPFGSANFGSVCGNDFGEADAQVACRQLGLGGGKGARAVQQPEIPPADEEDHIWLSRVACNGDELRIDECDFDNLGDVVNFCGHSEDIGVACRVPLPSPTASNATQRCDASTSCPEGWECTGGLCTLARQACEEDADCGNDRRCVNSQCLTTAAPFTVRLVWNTTSDIDTYVTAPDGCTTYYSSMTCDATGAYLEYDCTGGCLPLPQQEYTYVLDPTPGTYRIGINLYNAHGVPPPFNYTLFVTKQDGQEEVFDGSITYETPTTDLLHGCSTCRADFYNVTHP